MRLSTEKAIEFVENLEKYHPIQKYWDESNERHRQEKNTENYPYSYFRGVLIRKIAEIIEALQQENEQLQAQLDEWKYETKCHMDEVIAREKQIEQLQTQAVRMWEALRKAKEVLYNLRMDDYPGFSAICDALAAIDKVIGG